MAGKGGNIATGMSAARSPQWSPPVNGGKSPERKRCTSEEAVAAMEPACKWREKCRAIQVTPLYCDAAMEPACKWREKRPLYRSTA